ncbi:hypothetical protein BMS_2784 [Halobacteriovorax marinus SJ]|uniref:FHA domain-containing protein n=1 Tax=Halobacteriovorax marinus (strain ATCC BAA-682 / DSM 15412 / SJ) TaxID=862908 RepID=E1WY05_HALMS|nr:FHA domain-containing protein [Halobacteriovorax marinus]CBW27560.1 hypothetical protein BMS_2784 [Halobacteriovorax marinus SJ]
MTYYLINIENSDFIKIKDKLILGRKSSCDIVLKDDLVSGRHCRFHVTERFLMLEDLDASNPVQVNNQEMDSKSRIRINVKDKLKIGSTEFYLSDKEPSDEVTYKSMVLEKVKIHETFDSDLDYEQHQSHWHEEVSKKKNEIVKIQKKLNKVTSSKDKMQNLKNQVAELETNIEKLQSRIGETKNYSQEELVEKISLFSEKIKYYTEKRDQLFAIQTLASEKEELKAKKKSLMEKLGELSEEDLDKQHHELSKIYNTEVDALSKLNEKLKKS